MNLHLIDENGELSAEGELTNHLSTLVSSGDSGLTTEERLRSVGVKYHVVGVFGGQSSGKSTLLNKLFSTDFQTLDETVRRGQTTKGAFLNCAQGSNQASPLLVVDFEGTDGVERGEDQSFERQLSLFGLCVADTLIVNMWAVDVGRYNAANLSLLRTMFEVNLQLFSHDSYHAEERPTLLIVLRDFTEEDTAPSLKTIRTSFDTIWDGVARPAKFAKATIDDVFLLKFYFLPHYKLQQEQFSHSLDSLRDWFTSPQCPEYLFRHESMFRGVPLEGLPAYLNNCWEAIRTSKDLDIPSQRNMLAHHRCFEVKTQEVDAHTEYCREFEARIERGEMIEGLVTALDEEMTKRLASYTTHTTLYQQDVVSAFAEELQQELQALSVRTMNLYARNIATVALGGIESAVQSAVDDSIRQVLKAAHTFQLPPKSSTDDQEDAQVVLDKQTCNEFVRTFWSGMCRRLNKAVDQLRADPPAHSLFGKYTSAVSADPTMRAAVANQVTRAVFTKTHTRLAAMAETASETAHRGFEHCLTHGPDGSISFFSTTKGLLRAVPSAQLAGLSVLSCLLYFRLRLTSGGEISKLDGTKSCCARQVAQERRIFSVADQDEERSFFLECTSLTSLPVYPIGVNLSHAEEGEEDTAGKATGGIQSRFVLMNAQAVSRAYELFSQKCEFTMQLQIRTLEASKQRLPAWVFPVMLLLGWNELWYVLTSPTLLLLVIVVVALFFQGFIRTKWEEFQETGPASVVIPAQSAVRYIQQLYEHANDTMNGTSPGTRSGDAGGDQNDIELTTISASKKSQ